MSKKAIYTLLYAALIIAGGFAYIHLKYSHYVKTEGLVESNSQASGDDIMRGIEKIAIINFEAENKVYGIGVENTPLIPGERVTVLYEKGNPNNALYFNFFSAYLPTIITCIIITAIGAAAINSFVD